MHGIKVACLVPLLAAALLSACSSPTRPDEDPYETGEILSIELTPAEAASLSVVLARVWVRAPGKECGVVWGITRDTRVLVNGQKATVASLAVGMTADVWTEGLILTSCPGQGGADVIDAY